MKEYIIKAILINADFTSFSFLRALPNLSHLSIKLEDRIGVGSEWIYLSCLAL